MKRSRSLVATCFAGFLVVVGLAAPSQAGSGSTIRFWEHGKRFAVIDNGKKGWTVGDQTTSLAALKKDGKSIGHDGIFCTIDGVRKHEPTHELCTGAYSLAKGQITFEAQMHIKPKLQKFKFAITGGTRAYSNAAGWIDYEQHAKATRVVVHLNQ